MNFSAKVLKDSIIENSTGVSRLTTVEATFPRIILAEFNTHRQLSRNAASSRAIPVTKLIKQVEESPFIPIYWGKNEKGMQAYSAVDAELASLSKKKWLEGRDNAVKLANEYLEIGLHKQIINRLLEPWMWVTVIASATNWSNYFHLRHHGDAEPHINKIAGMMKNVILSSDPIELKEGDWHLPLTDFEGDDTLDLKSEIKVSVGRCARVSYLTHDGRRDIQADIGLHDRLVNDGHWSPFEHQAKYTKDEMRYGGNFGIGWTQYRKTFVNECR